MAVERLSPNKHRRLWERGEVNIRAKTE